MGRKSGGKANPRKAPAQRGLAAHHHGCALCLGMPAPQQGPGSKKKGEKKKRGRKVQTGPGEAGSSLGFSLAARGRAELGNKSPAPSCLRSAAFIRCQSNTKPSTTSEAKCFPEPPLLIPQASPLSQCSQRQKENKINTNNGAKPQQNPILGHERWLGAPRHHSSLPHPPRSLLPWLPP